VEPVSVRVYFTRDEEPWPVSREVLPAPDLLTATLAELLRGPTPEERAAGLTSWFSSETAGMLNGVRLDAEGRAIVDLADVRDVIPGASSSAGSATLLGELNGTLAQFDAVQEVEYRLDGSCERFWNFLQRDCEIVRFPRAQP
jgi:spore germination protein GerM